MHFRTNFESGCSLWVFVPTNERCLPAKDEKDDRDIWGIWADFRNLCTNYATPKFGVGLHLEPDIADEFVDRRLYRRWYSEPLVAFWFESSVFISSIQDNQYNLPAYVFCFFNVRSWRLFEVVFSERQLPFSG